MIDPKLLRASPDEVARTLARRARQKKRMRSGGHTRPNTRPIN